MPYRRVSESDIYLYKASFRAGFLVQFNGSSTPTSASWKLMLIRMTTGCSSVPGEEMTSPTSIPSPPSLFPSPGYGWTDPMRLSPERNTLPKVPWRRILAASQS